MTVRGNAEAEASDGRLSVAHRGRDISASPAAPDADGGAPAAVGTFNPHPRPLQAMDLLRLQRLAGNAAVSSALQKVPAGPAANRGSGVVVARQPVASGPTLESPHEEVNRRPAVTVGNDLHGRVDRYARLISNMRSGSAETQRDERAWYAGEGITGKLIDLFNSEKPTDPLRWDAVLRRWDEAQTAAQTALAMPVNVDKINDLGQEGQNALNLWQDAAEQTRLRREEYSRYLGGFEHAAGTIATTAVVVRDVSFAAAVGLAVIAAAPVVAGGVAAFGTGTLGLAAGSTSLGIFTYGGTALAMGVMGGAMEGGGQALATLGAQASMAVSDLIRAQSGAADNFNFSEVGSQGWEGFKRGFVDGVLAFAGAEAEKVVASQAGPAVRAILGPGNSSLMAVLIRRTLTRAISGGITGSVVGALQAGYRAAAEGQNLAGIGASMQFGFEVGGAAGAVAGGLGGAWEARGANMLQQRVAAELRATAVAPPVRIEDDPLVEATLAKLRANPDAGQNREILRLTPQVWSALHDPDRVAQALSEVWLEEHLLGVMAPRSAQARYGEAAMVLARRRGAPVIVLGANQEFTATDFFNEVVVKGNRFLDQSAVVISPDHGAVTHMVQDLAVDNVLFEAGVTSEQYRAMLANAIAPDGSVVGNDLWIEMFDSFQNRVNQPEIMYPAMRKAIPVP